MEKLAVGRHIDYNNWTDFLDSEIISDEIKIRYNDTLKTSQYRDFQLYSTRVQLMK